MSSRAGDGNADKRSARSVQRLPDVLAQALEARPAPNDPLGKGSSLETAVTKNGAANPLLVLRGGAPALSPARQTTTSAADDVKSVPLRGAASSGLRVVHRPSPRPNRTNAEKKWSEGLRRPQCNTWSPSPRGVAQLHPARPAARPRRQLLGQVVDDRRCETGGCAAGLGSSRRANLQLRLSATRGLLFADQWLRSAKNVLQPALLRAESRRTDCLWLRHVLRPAFIGPQCGTLYRTFAFGTTAELG
jgi:hypothetical protein